ncbi:hypothetical protein B0G77_7964 [Paraburkholderia sp. BL10I2N1]|nr:hypothetical protein B0G77_7964 [Paraburkholderia sp. BL10I2N1]
MADTADASGAADAVLVKMTQDGRNVEVISGWVCLAGVGEADPPRPAARTPEPADDRPRAARGPAHVAGRLPLTHEEIAIARGAMSAARWQFDASPAGIAPRLPRAVWAKIAAEDVE